jgi:hypothetical protein
VCKNYKLQASPEAETRVSFSRRFIRLSQSGRQCIFAISHSLFLCRERRGQSYLTFSKQRSSIQNGLQIIGAELLGDQYEKGLRNGGIVRGQFKLVSQYSPGTPAKTHDIHFSREATSELGACATKEHICENPCYQVFDEKLVIQRGYHFRDCTPSDTAPPFLTSALDGESDQLHVPDAQPRRNSVQYPLYRRLCGPQRRSGLYEEKTILPLSGFESRLVGRPARGAVTILSKLSRILTVGGGLLMSLNHSVE